MSKILSSANLTDRLTPESVKRHLASSPFKNIEVYEQVSSTNTLLREKSGSLPEFSTIIASEQTGGRGRRGRSFFSPAGTGLYLSILLRPGLDPLHTADITTAAAVAVCQAIEGTLSLCPSIKWVNDVLLDEKKVCGILTEVVKTSPDGGSITPGRENVSASGVMIETVIVGIGINVYDPDEGFPPELRDIAGALTSERRDGLRGQLAAAVMRNFELLYTGITQREESHIQEYRRRSAVIGHDVTVLSPDGSYTARAYDIDERCHLLVERPDGSREALSSGEISIRL